MVFKAPETIEKNEAMHYKLQMMGIPIEGEINVFSDNKCVATNSTIPQSTLQHGSLP